MNEVLCYYFNNLKISYQDMRIDVFCMLGYDVGTSGRREGEGERDGNRPALLEESRRHQELKINTVLEMQLGTLGVCAPILSLLSLL